MNTPFYNEYGGHLTARYIKPFFGLKQTQKWPVDGMARRMVRGVMLYVKPLRSKEEREFKWRYHTCHHNFHRLTAICPICRKHVSYGNLAKHLAIHPDYTQEEYEAVLRGAGFDWRATLPGHVRGKLANGLYAQFCEAAALDNTSSLWGAATELIESLAWENNHG